MKKYIILLLICVICLCSCGKKDPTTPEQAITDYSVVEDYKLKICDTQDCPGVPEVTYGMVKATSSVPEIVDEIKKLNQMTLDYYNEHSKQTLSSTDDCNGFKDVFNYRYSLQIEYVSYTDDKISNMGGIYNITDYCNATVTAQPLEIIYYDMQNSKVIGKNEVITLAGTTSDEIVKKVNEYSKTMLKSEDTYTIDDIEVYYNGVGNLNAYVHDKKNNTYFSTTVKEK